MLSTAILVIGGASAVGAGHISGIQRPSPDTHPNGGKLVGLGSDSMKRTNTVRSMTNLTPFMHSPTIGSSSLPKYTSTLRP
ncbi:uncharacterized protein PHACADRAFT_209897 [Phanerochaete carnosa HHB-10118-sp]|uniref:Uncharacterized protein n=1 Tax=Phanerochaete carnosa (strain HHB-10118-sp) TaxID=650164 RepID=K5UVL0_PHACS|nr:uncharacterized protein PHACADRAFT_209897 [Phanerochaete carnosa HHB-10118-sp]EKM54071.1 hypothetical protein PHACADRAFT_209897 [Phanerochaete carnosa HHB-10118-sp]